MAVGDHPTRGRRLAAGDVKREEVEGETAVVYGSRRRRMILRIYDLISTGDRSSGRPWRAGGARRKKALPSAAMTRRHLLQVATARTSQSGESRRRSISLSRSSGMSWMLAAAGGWSPVLRRGLLDLAPPSHGFPN
jgi:hypothetical protein